MFKMKFKIKKIFFISTVLFTSLNVNANQLNFDLTTANDRKFAYDPDVYIKIFDNDSIIVPKNENLRFIIVKSPQYGVIGIKKSFNINKDEKVLYSHLRSSKEDSFIYKICYEETNKMICSKDTEVKITGFLGDDFSYKIKPYVYPKSVLNVYRNSKNHFFLIYPFKKIKNKYRNVLNITYPLKLSIIKRPVYGEIYIKKPTILTENGYTGYIYGYKLKKDVDDKFIKHDYLIAGYKDANNNWVSDFFTVRFDIKDIPKNRIITTSRKKLDLEQMIELNPKNNLIKKNSFYFLD